MTPKTDVPDFKLDFATLYWTQAAPGARYKAFERDGKRVRLLELTREFVEADWCSKAHTGQVLEGELELDFNGSCVRFGAGDGLFIPAGESSRHKARSMTTRVLLFLVEDA